MDLRQLRYFTAIVDEGSVSRAAAKLNMTQPPLSAVIAQLERELGVRLLDRHHRGVDPTVAGGHLAREALRLMAQVDEVTEAVRGIGSGRIGRLTIAAGSPVAWEILPNLVADFDRRSPDVEIEISESPDAEVLERVRDRQAQVGVVYCTSTRHLERLRGRELEVAGIHREPLVMVLPSGSALAARPVLDLAETGKERWLMPLGGAGFPGLASHIRTAWEQAGIAPVVKQSLASLDTLLRLVSAGMGISMVPASVRRVAGSGLVVTRLVAPLAPLEAAVVWRRNDRPSPVLQRFLRAALATEEPDRLGPSVARHHVSEQG